MQTRRPWWLLLMLARRLAGEFLGTLFLLAIVVGSGIMGDRLSGGNAAVALLANSIATGLGLSVLILIFGPISGAHFNPLVTLANWMHGLVSKKDSVQYLGAQIGGALAGVLVAHIMFGEDYFKFSTHERSGFAQLFSEFIATFGLIMVIRGTPNDKIPFAVGAYIAAAYWFTASTSFANPVVTIARALTESFAGIRPTDILGFIVAQIIGAVAAEITFLWFKKNKDVRA